MKVSIIGATGYTGGELLRLISQHPEVELVYATSRKVTGKKVSEIHKNLNSFVDIKFTNEPSKEVGAKSDCVFTAVPHTAAMNLVQELSETGIQPYPCELSEK